MNGKQTKRIRKLAMTTAHSHNDTTLQGVTGCKLESPLMYLDDFTKTINYVNGHLVQRKLHPYSLKRIVKTIKALFKQTPGSLRDKMFNDLTGNMASIVA